MEQMKAVGEAEHKQRSKLEQIQQEAQNPRPTGLGYRIHRWWLLDGPTYMFSLMFWVICLILFLERFLYYNLNPKADKFFDIMNEGVAIARGCAAALRWSTCMVLLAVSRNFLTWLEETWVGNYVPLHKAIDFHKMAAVATLIFGLGHTVAHLSNMWHISHTSIGTLKDAFGDDVWSEKPGFITLLFIPASISYIPAITGWILLIVMAIMYSMAPNYVRTANFELFWYSHHLFIVFYISLIVHGAAGLLEFPIYWAWFLVPGTIFTIERFMRARRKKLPTDVVRATQKDCGVLGLELRKPKGFKYRAGGYMFVNCPKLSTFEYHPFTITSSPDEDVISFHIKSAGDWTTELYHLFDDKSKSEGLVFNIDGPFGAPSDQFDKFEYVVLVGAGIGVTPCASILKDLKYKIQVEQNITVKKIHFFWVAREIGAFGWFRDFLSVLQQEEGVSNILDIQGYITRGKPSDKNTEVFPINYFRPDFNKIFGAMEEMYPGKRIGVFYCGPAPLNVELSKQTRLHSSPNGTQFIYHKENF